MKPLFLKIKPVLLACSLAIAGCGGSSDSTDPGSDPASTTLSGTAAAGAAIIGTVTVKGAMGNTNSAIIEADGSYNVDVTGLTAPYRLRAQGTVGGKTYKLHSYAEAADVDGTVNITPFTDLIIANAAQQIAASYFDDDVLDSTEVLDPVEVEAQETALQARLQDVFDVLGLDTAIDLLNSTFSADHSGLDAALDIINIEVDTDTNVATITNLIDNSEILDSVVVTDDNNDTFVVPQEDVTTYTEAVSDTQAIANLFSNFAAEFVGGLPSSSDLDSFLATEFLQNDNTRGEFITDITTDPTLIGLSFAGVSVSNLDSTAGTASVTFNVVINDQIDSASETWMVSRNETSDWQLLGDQHIVDLETLSYHCNDYEGGDENLGYCGINTRFWDENFDNNGTSGLPIASGSVTIKDGDIVKDVFYLGTPDNEAPGEVQIYNESTDANTDGYYSGDWRAFGSAVNEIDINNLKAGYTVEYRLYTENLDLSDPSAPSVANGSEVATYTSTLQYDPSNIGLYPTATQTTLDALDVFTPGSNLTISWTLAAGTISDEVLVQVSDSAGNEVEIWDDSFGGSTTSISVASTEFGSLDPLADSFELLVRIYAADETTGQFHSTDYHATISSATDPGTDPVSNLTCGYESGWDDNADGGMGAPINPNSYADYLAVITDCGGGMSVTAQDVAGKSFSDNGETLTFFDTGTQTEQDPGTGQAVEGQDTIAFEWYVDADGYIVLYSDSSIEPTLPQDVWFRETSRLLTITSGFYTFYNYSEGSNYSDTDRANGSDGEIWYPTYQLLP